MPKDSPHHRTTLSTRRHEANVYTSRVKLAEINKIRSYKLISSRDAYEFTYVERPVDWKHSIEEFDEARHE